MFRLKNALAVWLPLILGILISLLAAEQVRRDIVADEASRLAHAADQIQLKLRERLESHELSLRGAAGLFAANGHVDRAQWKAYVEHLKFEEIIPAQGIGFAEVIKPEELQAHVSRIRAEGFQKYEVTPPGKRELYSAIIYLEPFQDRNLRAFGYDMYSEPVRRAAMEQARDTGKAALSGKVELVQETGKAVQAGTLMYVPVYRKDMAVDTVRQRQSALMGWAYSPFRMNDLITSALRDWQGQLGRGLTLGLFDGTEHKPAALLFSTSDKPIAHSAHPILQHRIIEFNGHQWLLALDHTPGGFGIAYTAAWLTLICGLMLSSLLAGLAWSLANTRASAARIAEKLTADIKQREQELADSEYRWKFSLEGSDLGVWDWEIPSGRVFFSKRWKEMLGHADHEIGDSLKEWSERVHPDDLGETMAKVQAYLEDRIPVYEHEHRVRCKDGSYKWILDRGMVVSRDAAGKPLRMIGTHADITGHKRAEQALIASRELLRSVVENAPIRIFWKDAALRYLGCNSAFARDAGMSRPEDLIGKDDFQLSWHEQAGLYRADDKRVMDSGTPKIGYEEPQTTADGRTIWLRTSKVPLRDEGGKVFGILGIYEDITGKKQSESDIHRLTSLYAALSECNAAIIRCQNQEELFKRLCEVVVDFGGLSMAWVGIADAEGKLAPVASHGNGLEYLKGIKISVNAGDPYGRGPTGTAARENRAIWVDDFRTSSFTSPWHDRASPYGWLSSAALPICRAGKPIGALTFYSTEAGGWHSEQTRDLLTKMASAISLAMDRFAAAEAAAAYQANLTESEQRFRTMVEQSIAGTFIIQDDRFAYVNPRFAQILGYPALDELIGMTARDTVSAKDRAMTDSEMQSFRSSDNRSTTFTFTALCKNGSTVEVGVSLAKAQYQQRPALIGLMQDISDRKVAEDQIRRYAKQLEHAFMQMVTLATTLSEMRDAYTAGHEKRVAEIAVAIGKELGLDAARLEGLRVGGYLHDVGKVSIPAEILAKPTRLTPLEYELIKTHAQTGYEVLKHIEFPWPVAQIALQHHERLDGSGYPNGLKGDEIMLEARITAVADVVESMGSHRPYRAALGIDKALAEIERGSGTIYDPEVANACLRLFREGRYTLQP